MATILAKREGALKNSYGRLLPWLHYIIITDKHVDIVECDQAALGGWRFGKVTHQGADDWGNLSADEILVEKRRFDDVIEVIHDCALLKALVLYAADPVAYRAADQ
jgi:hypothetical protein